MDREKFFKDLSIKNGKKIILLIMDGVGGIPLNGKTALEAAEAKNLNELAKKASCGRTIPVAIGVTPGSGPAHFSLFGYDPVKYNVGRGILEALGIDVEVAKHDVVARGNFCTIDNNKIVTDRRAGRIPTEKNREIIKLLSENIKEIEGVKIILYSGKEHRFVLKMAHPELSDKITDADPQKEGLPLKYPEPKVEGDKEKFTINIIKKFIDKSIEILKNSHPANGLLLRGFAEYPKIPSMQEIFKLNPAAIANYPMYRGLAKLVGMNVLDVGAEIDDEIETLKREWNNYDYFFVHIKKTDSYGEDGNFENKVKIIKKVDEILPEILSLKPDVIAITGDHSTPCKMEGHSWHPNPFMIYSDYIIPDDVEKFTERECAKGILGTFESVDILPLLLANSFKLKKFGA
jgi:2,3-bisphosphoglycerate-independent phosphoglycerate mutase